MNNNGYLKANVNSTYYPARMDKPVFDSTKPAMVYLYTKSNCVQCTATRKALENRNISYTQIDIEKDQEALSLVKQKGFLSAPVVIAGDDAWSGFRPDKISQLAQSTESTDADANADAYADVSLRIEPHAL